MQARGTVSSVIMSYPQASVETPSDSAQKLTMLIGVLPVRHLRKDARPPDALDGGRSQVRESGPGPRPA